MAKIIAELRHAAPPVSQCVLPDDSLRVQSKLLARMDAKSGTAVAAFDTEMHRTFYKNSGLLFDRSVLAMSF